MEKSYTVALKVIVDAGVVCAPQRRRNSAMNLYRWKLLIGNARFTPSRQANISSSSQGFRRRILEESKVSDVSPDAAQPREYQRLADGTLSVPVTALTVQGTTAGQWVLLQAVGAVLGIVQPISTQEM